MLNSEKNAFLDVLRASGIEEGMLHRETVVSKSFGVTKNFLLEGLKVQLTGSDLWFIVFKSRTGVDGTPMYACLASYYDYVSENYGSRWWRFRNVRAVLSDTGGTVYIGSIKEAAGALKEWLVANIPKFIGEKSIPDLWQMAETGGAITSLVSADDTPFSESERKQLRAAVERLRDYVEEKHEANEQQRLLVAQKLDTLKAALNHFGRASWFTFALGTLVSIGSTLYLNNEQGRALLETARQMLEGAVKYLN